MLLNVYECKRTIFVSGIWLPLNGCGETDDRRADVVSFLSAHNRTTLSSYIFATKARIDNRKKIIKQRYLPHMSSQYGELRLTSS